MDGLEVAWVCAADRGRYTPVRKNSSSTLFSLVARTRRRMGRPIRRAKWTARILPKLTDGTANDTEGPLTPVGPGLPGCEAATRSQGSERRRVGQEEGGRSRGV